MATAMTIKAPMIKLITGLDSEVPYGEAEVLSSAAVERHMNLG